MAEAQQHVAETMTEIVQGKELAHSEDTHKAAYDEPDISHESPERVDEAQQVLEDEGGGHSQEAQYVRDGATNRITELGTLFADFTAVITAAGPGRHSNLRVRPIDLPDPADPLFASCSVSHRRGT